MKTIIGIDPGVTGAMAVIIDGKFETIQDLPSISTDGFTGINPIVLDSMLCEFSHGNMVVYSEKSILPPGNGKMTTRSVYECRGVIRSVVALQRLPLIYVTPQAWKKFYNIPSGSDKERSRGIAMQRFPQLNEFLKLKKHHNRAEAALIAWYGWERENR